MSAANLSACAPKSQLKIAAVPQVDTLGPMPCEKDPSLVPNLADPKVKACFDKTFECNAQAKALHNQGENVGKVIVVVLPALKEVEQTLGPDHCLVGDLCSQAGQAYLNAGDLKSAERYIRRALAIRTRYLGDGCIDTARSVNMLANILLNEGRTQEAWDLVDAHWQTAQKQPPSLNARVTYLYSLGEMLAGQEKWAQARPYLTESVELKLSQPWLRVLNPDAFRVMDGAAACAIQLKDFDYASKTLIEAVRLRFGRRKLHDQSSCVGLLRCAEHWLSVKDDDKAEQCLQSAVQLVQAGSVNQQVALQVRLALNSVQARRGKRPD